MSKALLIEYNELKGYNNQQLSLHNRNRVGPQLQRLRRKSMGFIFLKPEDVKE